MIAEVRAEFAELGKNLVTRQGELHAEMEKLRQEIERVGRQVYLLGQTQRGLTEEVGGLPLAWRRFVDGAGSKTAPSDPRGEVLAGLMPLKDAFLAAQRQTSGMGDWRDAFAVLEARLDETLKELGAEPLAEPGMAFDARRHTAVLAAHSGAPRGTVLAVLRQGYVLSGALQRLAEVLVSLGPEPVSDVRVEVPPDKPETDSPEPEAGSPEPETDSPEPETGSPEPEASSPEPEADSPEPAAAPHDADPCAAGGGNAAARVDGLDVESSDSMPSNEMEGAEDADRRD